MSHENPKQPTFHEQWEEKPPENPGKPESTEPESEPSCDYCGDGIGGCRYCGFGKNRKK